MDNEKDKHIYVIFGGSSMEREGSIISACEVARALDKINIPNTMVEYSENVIDFLYNKECIAFICIHGENGEDGKMARLCELHHIPYTFSSASAHEFSFNKLTFKEFLKKCNVKTPETICSSMENREFVRRTIEESEYDEFILKPVYGGGSLGIKYFTIGDDYENIIFPMEKKYQPYFIERFINGIFLTCVVTGDPNIDDKLDLLEVGFEGKIYDYHKKHSNERKYILPSQIDSELTEEIKGTSQRLFQKGGYNGVVRFDYIVSNRQYFCLEVNTIPGLSKSGNAFTIWKHSGYSYQHLLELILNTAIQIKEEAPV